MSEAGRLGLFEAFGIELEYAVVANDSLNVRALVPELLHGAGANADGDVEFDDITWSNELAAHVVELKTTTPAPRLAGLSEAFQSHVRQMNALLSAMNARLAPTGMHPWMDSTRELKLWQQDEPVYETFNRIFDCRGHGWANLQSMHINLPFSSDAEFGRLHAAVRLVLPILPALAASSPFADGRATGLLDTRLDVYRNNSSRVPSVTGKVIPERAFSEADYGRIILERIYADLTAYDEAGVLRHEWANARGCIARFSRGSIEIRVLDTQECPRADLAVASAVVSLVRNLVEERSASYGAQCTWDEDRLAALFDATVRDGDGATISDAAYLETLGVRRSTCTARDLWLELMARARAELPVEATAFANVYAARGCLARRIVDATGSEPSRERLREVYERLCDCLGHGELFCGEP